MGLSVEVVRKPKKPLPEEIARRWAEEWAKEGKQLDWHKLMPPRGLRVLPRRWVVERTLAWISDNRPMSKDYREVERYRGGLRLRGDDTADGETYSPCIGVSRQSLEGLFSEVRIHGVLQRSPQK
jgi:hypothetical protein